MIYTKKTCSCCGYVIQPLKHDNNDFELGQPYTRCPRCGTYLIDKKRQEYIMFNWLSYIKYFIWSPIYGGMIGLVIGIFPIAFLEENLASELFSASIALAVFIPALIFLFLRYRYFRSEKVLSLKRTKDVSYLKVLLSLNLIANCNNKLNIPS